MHLFSSHGTVIARSVFYMCSIAKHIKNTTWQSRGVINKLPGLPRRFIASLRYAILLFAMTASWGGNRYKYLRSIGIFFIFLLSFSLMPAGYCDELNSKQVLRVAILDNPNLPEKLWMWSHYEDAYLAGVETAVLAAKKEGVKVEYKAFFYGAQPLDILEKIPEVQSWNPDFILGPHYSNQFLLLRKYFPNTLVLSSYASDPSIYNLPSNFYSIFPKDDECIGALVKFMNTQDPHSNKAHIIVQAECKDCVDISNYFAEIFKKQHKNGTVTRSEYVDSSLQNIDIAKLVEGYQKGDIIFLEPESYYLYVNLMARIADYLKEPHLSFYTSLDSWGNAEAPLKSVAQKPSIKYDSYRISALLLDDKSEKKLKVFNQLFSEHYGELPTDSLSYATYLSVMSAVSALKQFPANLPNLNIRDALLVSFKKALNNDPNWFRPETLGIYHYSNYSSEGGEVLLKTISVH